MMKPTLSVSIVEEEAGLDLDELSRACRVRRTQIEVWVQEGVLAPEGTTPDDWRFRGSALRRARQAQRLSGALELNPAGVALALDLLDEIAELRARLHRLGG
ncbi:MAG: MerR family transcriptional regulator [Proteobacteria bacterium]|nr:MerR family transcriptional regulator [Pseudomonadota bacterium]